MSRESKIQKELQDSAKYEKYIDTEFKNRIVTPTVVQQQLTVPDLTDEDRLQNNIARENLKSINTGPGLITEIILYLNDNGTVTDFNKYFPIFSKSINYRQLRNIDEFKKEWTLFESQKIGKKLSPGTTTSIFTLDDSTKYTQDDLERMSTEKLDSLFRMYLMKEYKKPIDDIDSFTYKTTKGTPSQPIKINNKEGIIKLGSNVKVMDNNPEKSYNEVKLRYVYQQMNPDSKSLKNVFWKGSSFGSPSGSPSGSPATTAVTGSGLNTSGLKTGVKTEAERYLKKKSVLMSFR